MMDQAACWLQLVIMQNGVEGDEHFGPVAAGKFNQSGDIAQAVASIMAGAETWATDIDRIGPVQNSFTGDTCIAGGAE
ncbi:hypothetical protein D3C75_1305740 [compost metagenome]